MELSEVVDFFDTYLRVNEFKEDAVNGLQVEGEEEVEKIVFCVDASMESFVRALEVDANMVFCHHGLIWGGIRRVDGILRKRLKFLLENELSLYSAHLPLDAHREVGNNACLLRLIDVEPEEPFGEYKGYKIGYAGYCDKEFEEILEVMEENFENIGYLKFGRDKVEKVAAISGRGAFAIDEAKKNNVDLLITGEMEHSAYHLAKDNEMNVIFVGHYQSETLGLKKLVNLTRSELGIEAEFIDIPTGL